MVVISELVEPKEYEPEELKHLQDILLSILKDFIEFCDEHDITYFIDGGSTLGCVRHNGFIPWDDDVDVILFRDQYDKFLEVRDEFDDKYDILNMDDYEDYCRLYTKISLKGTKTGDIFDKNTDFTFGIHIDVFVFDDVPNPGLKRVAFTFMHSIFRKLLNLHEIIICDVYISKNKERLGHIIRFIFKILGINNKTIKKYGLKLINKSKKLDSNFVSSFSTPYYLFPFPKTIFNSYNKAKFESIEVNLAQGYEEYLEINFGKNWRELPPIDKRINHKRGNLDFGKY